MQLHQMAAKRKRRFVLTTDSKHGLLIAENKLKQPFQAYRPNQNAYQACLPTGRLPPSYRRAGRRMNPARQAADRGQAGIYVGMR